MKVAGLEKLHKTFTEERKVGEAQEHHQLHAFRVKHAGLAAQISRAKKELDENTERTAYKYS